MNTLLIDRQQVAALLPMAECIDVMAEAMTAVSAGSIHVEPRLKESFAGGEGAMLLMRAESAKLGVYAIKQISLLPRNAGLGKPVIQGVITLFELASGSPVAVIDGTEITALRTAATSGLATRELARADACSLGIFGTGVQAVSHMAAVCAVRPIEEIRIWGRDFDKAGQLAGQFSGDTRINVQAVSDPALAGACDILCTVTGSAQPVLKGEWVQAGTHINLVGAHSLDTREADTALMARSSLYVDLLASVRAEAGDIVIPIQEGAIGEDHIIGEIGQLLAGKIRGRTAATEVTLYKSLGLAAQDLYAANHVYRRACLDRE
jgi:ornithine cyclodeaminase/alanine dehydrogenase-like protein (mu-crystallin family)